MPDIIHTPDESRGRNEDDDVIYAICGKTVRLGDMHIGMGCLVKSTARNARRSR